MAMKTEATSPIGASSVILLRDAESATPRVLMGKRKSTARFMPNARVFPGGAVDPEDVAAAALLPAGDTLPDRCAARLAQDPRGDFDGVTLALAAIRETFEETGLRVGRLDPSATALAQPEMGASWAAFAASGARPQVSGMIFVLRAVTPPEMRIRFDARIFVVDADAYATDLEDFSGASGELEDLRWLTFSEAVAAQMPFPTSLALAEVMAKSHKDPDRPAPFLDQATETGVIVGL